jgi:polysaccharide export outer membrane protein
MRHHTFAAVLIGASLLAGCAATQSYPPADPETYNTLVAPYRLDSGDRLRVVVFGQPDLSNTYTIEQGGYISMPLVGDVMARGRSTRQMQGEIAARLAKGFVKSPDVSVEVDRYRPFFIMGEVTSAGQYPYVNGMTAQTAVAIGGGFTPRAQRKDLDVTRQVDGKVTTFRILPTQPVYPGDTVNVRERYF